ncbi:MAG: Type 1 glutamine amidotransferase-like domain-containing protein [Nanoarchaeota archaeon]|nr:Type 1 glutamine amidotransferase-like domain-containing protein [Nanoarchaeota archaeon]
MKGKVFLAGGGSEEQSYDVDKFFSQLVSRVLYIPIAWNNVRENEDYKPHLKWLSTTLGKFGVHDITLLTDLEKNTDLENFDAIYIGGGNTFKLLNFIKKSDFDDKLKKFIEKGGIVYGGSAGALIFGNDINIALLGEDRDENNVNLKDLKGLNILKNIDFQVHFNESQINRHKNYIKQTKRNILAIPEESAILIEDKKCKVLGSKPVYFISKENSICFEIGSEFKIDSLEIDKK